MITPRLPHTLHRPLPSRLAGTPPAFRRIEVACIAAFPFAAAALSWHVWTASSTGLLALACVAGFLGADFGSGVLHWFFDTWFSPDTPFIGRAFVRTFREHHVDPDAICRHDFVETNGSNVLAGTILMLCGLCTETESAVGAFTADVLFFTGIFSSVTSQIHKWAHAPVSRVPRVIRWLQRRGIILSRETHAGHHHAPFDDAYCITSGWLNDVLRHLGFFRSLERVIATTTGATPRRDDLPHSSDAE